MSIKKLAERLGVDEFELGRYFTEEEAEKLDVYRAKELLWKRVDQQLRRSEVKRRLALSMQDCGVFQAWKKTPAIDLPEDLEGLVEKFLTDEKAFLIIHGDVGTYKTRWLLKVSQKIFMDRLKVDRGRYPSAQEVFYLSWPDFVASYHLREERAKEALSKALSTEYLFLDDFLSATLSEHYLSLAFLIVSERYTHIKKTFVTTNANLSEIRKTAEGDLLRLVDRLLDKNLSVFYKAKGQSSRLPERQTFTEVMKVGLGI